MQVRMRKTVHRKKKSIKAVSDTRLMSNTGTLLFNNYSLFITRFRHWAFIGLSYLETALLGPNIAFDAS